MGGEGFLFFCGGGIPGFPGIHARFSEVHDGLW